jgi:hypothetical protein
LKFVALQKTPGATQNFPKYEISNLRCQINSFKAQRIILSGQKPVQMATYKSPATSHKPQIKVRESSIVSHCYYFPAIGIFIGMPESCDAVGIPARYAYIHSCHLRSSSSGVVPNAFATAATLGCDIFVA